MRKSIIILILLFLYVCTGITAFDYNVSGGARVLGMGGAFVGVENEGEGALINPASIFIQHTGFCSIMYSPLYVGLDDGSFSHMYFNLTYLVDNLSSALNFLMSVRGMLRLHLPVILSSTAILLFVNSIFMFL